MPTFEEGQAMISPAELRALASRPENVGAMEALLEAAAWIEAALSACEAPDRDMTRPCEREDCDYTFEKDGRICGRCSRWMVDFGD